MCRYKIFSFLLVMILAQGCFHKELEDVKLPAWKPGVAFPIITASFTVEDILQNAGPEGSIRNGSNDIVEAVYNHRLLSKNGSDVFSIPEFLFDIIPVDEKIAIPMSWPNGDILKELSLKEGFLEYLIEWQNAVDGSIEIVIPQAIKDGIPYSEVIATLSGQDLYEGKIDLSGYTLEFDMSSALNELEVGLKILAENLPENELIDRMKGQLTGLVFKAVEGYLKSFELSTRSDTIDFDLTRNWVSGSVVFVNPRISFFLDSDFAFPLSLRFSNFNSSRNGITTQLSGSVVNSGWNTMPGKYADTVKVNSENSNIQDFFSITPRMITYEVIMEADIDPDINQLHTLRDDSQITVDVEAEIPFECSIKNAIVRDTFDVAIERVDQVYDLMLDIVFENSFPHDIAVQMYFADADGVVLDSLLADDTIIIQSGLINEAGEVIAPVSKKTTIRLTGEKLENLYRASKIVLQAIVATADNGNVFIRYHSTDALSCRIGAVTTLKP